MTCKCVQQYSSIFSEDCIVISISGGILVMSLMWREWKFQIGKMEVTVVGVWVHGLE